MEPAKVSAVVDWPIPSDRKQLQRFWGFSNFYRRFIRNYSAIAAPLHALTSPGFKFLWNTQAEEALNILKQRFTASPTLSMPDPKLQFIVEVDASDVGVGAVLSKCSLKDNKVHPCAFFSRKLSKAVRNYDVGNWELLAVKLALEEWRHWLEGAELPFLVWTDHKNLEYIRTARRLNSRQARKALFFNRFNFTLSYRPGSRNTKPDALFHQFETNDFPRAPSTILPAAPVIGAFTWDIVSEVRQALEGVQIPDGCPQNLLFIPIPLRPRVLQWGHASRVSCHPGVSQTVSLLKQPFWWPSSMEDVGEFVSACSVAAQNKTSRKRLHGLLCPLPAPCRP